MSSTFRLSWKVSMCDQKRGKTKNSYLNEETTIWSKRFRLICHARHKIIVFLLTSLIILSTVTVCKNSHNTLIRDGEMKWSYVVLRFFSCERWWFENFVYDEEAEEKVFSKMCAEKKGFLLPLYGLQVNYVIIFPYAEKEENCLSILPFLPWNTGGKSGYHQ